MKKTNILFLILVLIIAGVIAYFLWPESEEPVNKNTNSNINTNRSVNPFINMAADDEELFSEITAPEAKEMIDGDSTIIILDVSASYEKGHLVGAVNYPVEDNTLENSLADLDKEATYLVYGYSDNASIAGAQILGQNGFANVYRLEGNYPRWLDYAYPIEK
ncbi:rhodanese-like domain-containing protein [Patescibacteria group bacterium]|nr:rhodanese-like domain-containing protein [Patescibacteria group bacterium]